MNELRLRPIGVVRSTLTAIEEAPNQASEGAPEATVSIFAEFADAAADIEVGDELMVLTWLDRPTRSACTA